MLVSWSICDLIAIISKMGLVQMLVKKGYAEQQMNKVQIYPFQ